MARRTKVVCTLGPATRGPGVVPAMVDAGMDVARLNFSHGTREEHAEAVAAVRAAEDASGRAVAVLADLQGPKIRLGHFEGGSAVLEPGSDFVVTPDPTEGTSHRASVSGVSVTDLDPGDTVLMDDGAVRLRAVSSDGHEVTCEVLDGGSLSDCKGVNLPGAHLETGPLTEKDIEDLRFVLELGIDLVALSFVRGAHDVKVVHDVMDDVGRRLPVIAKIEKPEAVDDLEAVVDAFDGIMVARGDLGVELSLEQVPSVQKRAVQLARKRNKPAIVATQMLESMVDAPRPTRAEVSDVANAVLDGADALMLSGETSVGAHAVEAVATMARIISTTEADGLTRLPLRPPPADRHEALAAAAVDVARSVSARCLVAFTESGRTAQRLATHRSSIPLLAFTTKPEIRRQLCLTWDMETFLVPPATVEEGLAHVDAVLQEREIGRAGDAVVVVAGQAGQSDSTHTVRIHELGSASG